MKLDSEQKRVLKAGLPASLGAVLGTIVGMLVQGILGSKIPKKDDDSAQE